MTGLPPIGHTTGAHAETPALRAAMSPSPDGVPPASPRPGTHRLLLLGATGMAARSAGCEPVPTPARERKERILVEAAGAPQFRARPLDVPGPGERAGQPTTLAGPAARFLVQSTTGYSTDGSRPITEWVVCDRLDAMRVVWRSHEIDETGREQQRHRGDQESIARTIAARLERAAR